MKPKTSLVAPGVLLLPLTKEFKGPTWQLRDDFNRNDLIRAHFTVPALHLSPVPVATLSRSLPGP